MHSGLDRGLAQLDAMDSRTMPVPEIHRPSPIIEPNLLWRDPKPLVLNTAAEEYPLDALPKNIRDAVEEFALHVKAPVSLIASSALATVSLVTQAYVRARRDETMENPVSLYMLTIAESGERKSTCDRHFMKVVRDHDLEQSERYKPELEIYKAELEAWEAKRAGHKSRIQESTKKGKDTQADENDLRSLERDKPLPPRVPRLVYSDATPEALAYNLATRWPSGGVMSSEAGLVLGAHAMNSETIMRNLGQLNVLWDGAELHIDRKSSDSFSVRDVCLTIGLMVQEATLREFFSKSGRLTRGTGFLARFLIAWPESTQGMRPYTEPPSSWPARDKFNQQLSKILDAPVPLNERGDLEPPIAILSPAAKEFWKNFYNEIEIEMRIGGELSDVRDVAAKTADNAVRLATIFQFFANGSYVIDTDALDSGCRIAAWHLNEARRFFGEIALPADLADLVRLDSWLLEYARKKRIAGFSTTEVLQYVSPIKFRKASALREALGSLELENRIRVEQDGRKKLIQINPALLVNR
jgi:putative DNA primase/helicase